MEYRALKEKQRLKAEQEERERIAATKVHFLTLLHSNYMIDSEICNGWWSSIFKHLFDRCLNMNLNE